MAQVITFRYVRICLTLVCYSVKRTPPRNMAVPDGVSEKGMGSTAESRVRPIHETVGRERLSLQKHREPRLEAKGSLGCRYSKDSHQKSSVLVS